MRRFGSLPIRLMDLQLLHEVKRAFRRHGEYEVMADCIIVVNWHERCTCFCEIFCEIYYKITSLQH